MLQRLVDLPRLLQLWALQHDGESHHFAPSMLALCLKIWNTQHAIDWNLLFSISSFSLPPSHSGDLQPSDRHGSKVLGPVVHLPDWGFIILFFQENLDKHFPRFHFFKKFLKNIFYVSMYFFQESSHPFHPLLGRGGSGQGDGVHQEPEGIQDLLPGVWDMIGKCWIADSALQNTDAHTTFKYSIVKSTWHLFAQFIEGYLIQYINRSTR